MLAAKLDLLLKKLDKGNRQRMPVSVHSMNSYSMYEVCGDGGHSGNDCPETHEDAAYINNNNNTGFCPQGGQGWGQTRPPFHGGGNNFNSNFNSNFQFKPTLLERFSFWPS